MTGVAQKPWPTSRRMMFGHPIGLLNLFGVELWERFSFYGMLTLLGYYLYYSLLDGGLGLEKSTATGIVGAYGGLMYLSTMLGGWVADRMLGMERCVFYGALLVMAGHTALAVIPGLQGVGIGLVMVALGSGAVKANASSLLGTLYDKDDRRIDGGFTLFFLGINIGALTGPLITGVLQINLDFHYGFGAAAIGMSVGLAQYAIFRRNLGIQGRTIPNPLRRNEIGKVLTVAAVAVAVVLVVLMTGLVTLSNLAWTMTGVIAAAAFVCFVVILISPKVTAVERTRVVGYIPLFIANAVFCSLFQQVFTVLAVYSDERMNWSFFGWTAPSNWLGWLEPAWVIALSPLLVIVWTRLGNRAPSAWHKVAYGVIGMGAAFLLFVPLAGFSGRTVPALLVFFVLGGFAVAELLMSPTLLAVTTQLAPEAFRAQMMAVYFLSAAIGSSMSGVLSRFYDASHEVAYFGITGVVAVAVGLVIYGVAPRMSGLMHAAHER